MSCSCGAMGRQAILLSCSGMSNVGQLANAAAIRLHQEGLVAASCVVCLAVDMPHLIHAVTDVPCRVVIDGCPMACARRALKSHGLTPDAYVVVSSLGIEKDKVFDLPPEQVEATVAAVKTAMGCPQV